jgi:MFS family permease
MSRRRLSFGWVIVAASLVMLVGAVGTQACFGLFLKPLSHDFGWSRAGVSGAMSLLLAVSGLMGVVMGRVTDRYGARAAMAPGIAIGTLSYALVSRIDSLWQFYLLVGLGGGILVGCANTPAVTAVSRWFGAQRTTAIGILLLGPTLGQVVLAPSISSAMESWGWRDSWLLMAAVAFVCGLPALGLLDRRRLLAGGSASRGSTDARKSGGHAEGLSGKEATRTVAFWILMATGVALGLGFWAFTAHIVAHATDAGVPATTAALILTLSSVGAAVGTLLAGPIAGKLGDRWALVLFTALHGVALLLFIAAGSVWAFSVLALVLGLAFGAVVPVRIGVAPRLFGLRALGTIIGFVTLSFSVGAIGGSFLTGYIFDTTGSYDLAFVLFGALLLADSFALLFLRVPTSILSADPASGATPIWRAGDGLG